MRASVVLLYNPVLFEYSRVYRLLLVMGRMIELSLTILRLALISIPIRLIFGEKERELAYADDILPKGRMMKDRADYGTLKYQKEYWENERKHGGHSREFGNVRSGWRILRVLLEELGSTFIKLGQLLSMLPISPPSLRQELQHLQERVPTMKFKEVKRNLEREWGVPLEEIFSYFEEQPFASASLAQMHRARLRKENVEVAVKVQRAHLPAIVAIDLLIIDFLFFVLKIVIPEFRHKTDMTIFTAGFGSSLVDEIDFTREAQSQERLKAWYTNEYYRGFVKVADIYWDYVTGKVIVMELLKGMYRIDMEESLEVIRSTTHIGIPRWDVNQWPLLNMIGAIIMDSLLAARFAYMDSHLGNMYFSPSEKRLFIVDFGMCQPITQEERHLFADFFAGAWLYADGHKLAEAFLAIHASSGHAREEVDIETLENRCKKFTEKWFHEGQNLLYGWGGGMTDQLLPIIGTKGLHFPTSLWYALKSALGLFRIGVIIDPAYDARMLIVGYVGESIKDRMLQQLEDTDMTNVHEAVNGILEPFTGFEDLELVCWGAVIANAEADKESKAAQLRAKGAKV